VPSLVGHIPSGLQWAHEIKWDGYRASLYIADGKVAIRADERISLCHAARGLPGTILLTNDR